MFHPKSHNIIPVAQNIFILIKLLPDFYSSSTLASNSFPLY